MKFTVINGKVYFCTKCFETELLELHIAPGETRATGRCAAPDCGSTALESRIA
jgi:hypothetical protein